MIGIYNEMLRARFIVRQPPVGPDKPYKRGVKYSHFVQVFQILTLCEL